MSIQQSGLSRYQKELAIFGYIRHNSIQETPVAINQLCVNYFDEIFYILIRGNALKQFLKMKTGQRIEKTFKYNSNISFKCRLYPNGHFDNEKGNTLLFVKATCNKSLIHWMMWNHEMECKNTNSHHISSGYKHLKNGTGSYFGWYDGCMKLSEYQTDQTLKSLIFSLYINVTFVKYNDNTCWIQPFKLNKKTTFKWKLTETIKNTIKDYPVGKSVICGISRDHCWVMYFAPKGFDEVDEAKPTIKYTFLRWCDKIKTIDAEDTIVTTNGIIDAESYWQMDYRNYGVHIPLTINPVDVEEEMELKIEIMITKIMGDDDNIVAFPENGQLVFDY